MSSDGAFIRLLTISANIILWNLLMHSHFVLIWLIGVPDVVSTISGFTLS